jgi:hypothetical protein
MRETARDLGSAGWTTVVVDVEGMRTEEEFLRALCKEIERANSLVDRARAHFTQRFNQLMGGDWGDAPIRALGQVNPRDFAEALIAALNDQQRETVIFIDEIALFVAERLKADEASAGSFLYHLRRLRQQNPKVRWLLTGSIGLDVVARRVNLQGALVDLEIFPLDPFTPEEARSFLKDLVSKGQVRTPCGLDDGAFDHLATELGWLSPYYLRLVFDRIRPTGARGPGGLPLARPEDVERAFEALLAPNQRGNFATWEEHIEKNFPPEDSKMLQAILDACCDAAEGEVAATIQARLSAARPALTTRALMDGLTALSVAGFVHETGGRWRFTSGLLRRYWFKYRRS